MKASYSAMGRALLVGIMFATAAYSEPRAEEARQQIRQAVASGNVQSVISALPALERMWPNAMEEYFRTAEEIVRFLNGAGGDFAVQQALESLYAEVLAKRCPSDDNLLQATAYFDLKRNIILYSFGFENMGYRKSHLLAVSRFLGEVRDRRISNYQNKGTARPGLDILNEAGVFEASSLTNPVQIKAYEKAQMDNMRDMQMNGLQLALFSADQGVTFTLLNRCAQLRHDGKLDEAFANEVAENARLTENEREMRYEFDKDK